MSVEASSIEGKTMKSLVEEFCKEWCSKKSEMEEMKEETIKLIAHVQTLFVTGSIKVGDMVGPNLHREFDTLMEEIRDLKTQMKFLKDSEEAMIVAVEKTNAELQEKFEKSKSTRSSKASYGPFSSKVAKDFADENGIDGKDIEGSGKDNKITKKDIQAFLGKATSAKGKTTKVKKHCNGAKESGSPCNNSGSILIKGKWYCKKHQKQAVQEDLKEELEEEYSDYDEENDTKIEDELTRYRKESLKSIDNMDEYDANLNSLVQGEELYEE